jgi:hypothetical protein
MVHPSLTTEVTGVTSVVPSTCGQSPASTIAFIHLRSLTLHLQSLPSTCDRSPPPAIAPQLAACAIASLYLRLCLLPSICDRCPSTAAFAPLHLQSESLRLSESGDCWAKTEELEATHDYTRLLLGDLSI